MSKARQTLTIERVRELLDYSVVTGRFYWRTGRRGVRAGSRVGTLKPVGYEQVCVDRVVIESHRLAWFWVTGEWPPADVDHQNGAKACNGFHNLRPATKSQNACNTGPRSTSQSGFKGVSYNQKDKAWWVRVQHEGKIHIKTCFSTALEAHQWACEKREELHGSFANHG